MWNINSTPLAYLITFRCYGSWLHGDERGSTDRFQNIYKTSHITANEDWHRYNTKALKYEPVTLNEAQRSSVEKGIRGVCDFHEWHLWSINVRTNHVHFVVCIGDKKPGFAIKTFKEYATKQMRADGCWPHKHSPWSEKGSRRSLWNEESINRANNYVNNEQGGDIPEFE